MRPTPLPGRRGLRHGGLHFGAARFADLGDDLVVEGRTLVEQALAGRLDELAVDEVLDPFHLVFFLPV
jgi:hypothetical protein